MSTYSQYALSTRPKLYLSAPTITDQSGTTDFTLSNNNLSATGQPIIFGSNSSFYMTDSTTVDIVGNPLFFNEDSAFECVVVAKRPNDITSIIIDDDSRNAVLLTPDGITLKLFFENSTSTYSKTITIPVRDWNRKFYIIVIITSSQATLSVNGESMTLVYSDNIVESSNVTIGGGTGYSYLIDGIGFYGRTFIDKSDYINDPGGGYSSYVAQRHGGVVTRFEGYTSGYTEVFNLSDFIYSDGYYTLVYNVSSSGEGLEYLSIKCNDETISVIYDVDLGDFSEFTDYLLLDDIDSKILRLIVSDSDVDDDFQLVIHGVQDSTIGYSTPAELSLEGMALFGKPSESIVNFPDGTKLDSATFTGTWIYGDGFEGVPKTVEIVFRPVESENDTYVFYSSDGQAAFGDTGSISSNFTAYLNGVLVTDLSAVRYDQWNHLVLVDDGAAATEFYLNSTDGSGSIENISYMLLTGYQDALSEDEIQDLYAILIGSDMISTSESMSSVSEGEFANGLPFNYYSHTWAIVGAGGS